MSEQDKIQLFENQKIRTAWDTEKEEWYFSVTDVIAVLTEQPTARGASNYWAKLKQRLKEEGADELLTNCQQLKMIASDGKHRATDVATTEQLLRIIQSIPSPKAEPFRLWLAEVGRERIEETIDPEQAIDRALETYLKKGYDPDWVHQRLLSIRIRNELTNEWQQRGVVELDDYGYVVTHGYLETSVPGVYAAGDLRAKNLRQVVTATADGAIAAVELERYAKRMSEKTGLTPQRPVSCAYEQSTTKTDAASLDATAPTPTPAPATKRNADAAANAVRKPG